MKKFLRILLVVVAALVLIGVGVFAGFRISSYQYAAMAAQSGTAQFTFPFLRPHFRQVVPQGNNPAVPQQGQPNQQVPQQGQPQGGNQAVPPQGFQNNGRGQQFWGPGGNQGFGPGSRNGFQMMPGSRNGFQMMPGSRGGFQEMKAPRFMLPLALLVLCPVGLVILGLAVWGVIALLRRRSKTQPTHPCPHCSKPVQDGWVACPSCGKSLEEKPEAAPEPESK